MPPDPTLPLAGAESSVATSQTHRDNFGTWGGWEEGQEGQPQGGSSFPNPSRLATHCQEQPKGGEARTRGGRGRGAELPCPLPAGAEPSQGPEGSTNLKLPPNPHGLGLLRRPPHRSRID